jgi:hypothetical protein
MLSARSARRIGWLFPALLGGFLAFGSTAEVAHAQKKPAKVSAKVSAGKSSKTAAKPAAPAVSAAEEQKRTDAKKFYTDGEAKLAGGDYAGALKAYKGANDLIPASVTLYKMAFCLDKQNKTSEALAAYESFLGSNPPEKVQDKVIESRGRVADLKKRIGPPVVLVMSEPLGASVTIDGVAQVGVTPMDVKLAPGTHKIRVSTPGYAGVTKEINVEAGVPKTVDVSLPKAEAVATAVTPTPVSPTAAPGDMPSQMPAEPTSEKRSNVVGYALLGVAGAGVVVGSVFGIQALGDKSDFNGGEKTNAKADSVEKNALIADMAFGAALTLGVTGIVLLVSNSGSSSTGQTQSAPRQALQVVPVVSLDRAGAAATIRF